MSELEYLDLQGPLPHQEPWLDAFQRFLLLQCGRRSGKGRAALFASIMGRGPGWRENNPLHKGIISGGDVVWLAPDKPQAKAIWFEEIKPRTEHLSNVRLNNSDLILEIKGAGKLHVLSAESGTGGRGLGAHVVGLVIDEAAHMDLKRLLFDVYAPLLLDRNAWVIIASTPNAGMDGNTDHRTPSFFNILCQEILDGVRDPEEWVRFFATARDNPVISQKALELLIKEYPPGSPSLEQEVNGKLVPSGAGLAFPEWDETHHVVAYDPPRDWAYFASVDWGYSDHCAGIFYGAGPKDLLARSEIYVQKKIPYDVGFQFGQHAKRYPKLEYVAGGSDMWDVRDGGQTIAEKFQAGLTAASPTDPIILISVPRGKGSREAGKLAVHEFLKHGDRIPDPTDPTKTIIPIWDGAKLRVHRDCKNLIRTLPQRPLDPKNNEDVWEGGEDHLYDSLRYALAIRFPRPEEEEDRSVPTDRHPGWDLARRQKRPHYLTRMERERELRELEQAAANRGGGYFTGIRWGTAQPSEDDAA